MAATPPILCHRNTSFCSTIVKMFYVICSGFPWSLILLLQRLWGVQGEKHVLWHRYRLEWDSSIVSGLWRRCTYLKSEKHKGLNRIFLGTGKWWVPIMKVTSKIRRMHARGQDRHIPGDFLFAQRFPGMFLHSALFYCMLISTFSCIHPALRSSALSKPVCSLRMEIPFSSYCGELQGSKFLGFRISETCTLHFSLGSLNNAFSNRMEKVFIWCGNLVCAW